MEAAAKHTPGPWLYTDQMKPSGGRYIRQAPEAGGADEIAFVGYWGVSVGEANARLIAAAPELLAAAKRAIPYINDDPNDPDGPIAALLAAIAAATGSAS